MDIGDYHVDIRTLLGKGSYGSVYRGYKRQSRIPVAVKQIENANHLNKSTLEEIQNLMSVDHNNIVKLLNVYDDNTCWWIVLEYCDQDLEKYLTFTQPDLDIKLDIMHQCASGVTYLHNLKTPIVHRDIKLNNILLQLPNSVEPIVKLCDFGLSKMVKTQDDIMTSDIGTLAFRAPEFFSKEKGSVQYTLSVDTFALGLVFKVLLDYGPEGYKLYPSTAEIEGDDRWMLTFGMTLDECHKKQKRGPVLFFMRSDDSDQTIQLKSLIINMTAYESTTRPKMENVKTLLINLRIPTVAESKVETDRRHAKELDELDAVLKISEETVASLRARNRYYSEVMGTLSEENSKLKVALQQQKKEIAALNIRHPKNMDDRQDEQKLNIVTKQYSMLKDSFNREEERRSSNAIGLSYGWTEGGNNENAELKLALQQQKEEVAALTARQVSMGDKIVKDRDDRDVVCALDIGTQNSGIAFAFPDISDRIFMTKKWNNHYFNFDATQASMLIGSNGEFLHFGSSEEIDFEELEGKPYHLFRNFSLSSLGNEITKETEILSTNGFKFPAFKIFSFAINHLKEFALVELGKKLSQPPPVDMIQWLLPIPATCSDSAQQFVREVAVEAGLTTSHFADNLLLVREPDAVTYLIRKQSQNYETEPNFLHGTKNLFVKIEEYATEITTHETLNKYCMRDVSQANVVYCGGRDIFNNFYKFLSPVLGLPSINDYNELDRWIYKFYYSLHWGKPAEIALSYYMIKSSEKITGTDIERLIKQHSKKGLSYHFGKLILSNMCVRNIVMPAISGIIRCLETILEGSQISEIIVVSTYEKLATILKSELVKLCSQKAIEVIVPEEPALAVIKGTVTYGLNRELIASFMLKHTYGISTEPKFNVALKSLTKQKANQAQDVFQLFATQDESVRCGLKMSKTFMFDGQKQQSVFFEIFRTDVNTLGEVKNVDRSHFRRVGVLNLSIPQSRLVKYCEVVVDIMFAGTEFWITAKHETTGVSSEILINIE